MMKRVGFACAALIFLALAAAHVVDAAATNTAFVSHVARGSVGTDAGIDLTGGGIVRVTASGTLRTPSGACGSNLSPDGCAHAFSLTRESNAPVGTLLAAFVGRDGRLISQWTPIGRYGSLPIPSGAARLVLRINGIGDGTFGAFKVVSSAGRTLQDGAASGGVRRLLGEARQVGTGSAVLTRKVVQNALRRFAFSDTPANVTAVYASGLQSWFSAQLSPDTLDDSALSRYLTAEPNNTGLLQKNDNNILCSYGTLMTERQVSSKKQLLEKMTMYWLEHFSINGTSNIPGPIGEYNTVVRADALGNFGKLVSDVAVLPAMLDWLGNNHNIGSDPVHSPPNQNFGRELMQLYVMGTDQLNVDGTSILDGTGTPKPNYAQADVDAVSLALTGYSWSVPNPYPLGLPRDPAANPVTFTARNHGKGPYQIIGKTVNDPGDQTVITAVISSLVSNPSTAPFQAREMLQRMVTENPSPAYVARIAQVWSANVNDPHQIATVIAAIAADPEFIPAMSQPMLKETVEYELDAIRALGGASANPVTGSDLAPLQGVRYDLESSQQLLYDPETVFGFYTVGDKSAILSNGLLLSRYLMASRVANAMQLGTLQTLTSSTGCGGRNAFNIDARALATMNGTQIASYLLDALVDGGNPELRALVQNYINNDPKRVAGAVYIIMSSPEYEVN